MKVLGLSFGYHDAAACLVVDGEVVAASAEERFTRQKHDADFPMAAARACLEVGALDVGALDQVVFHEDPHAKFSRVLAAALGPWPGSRREFVNSMKSWLGRKLWAVETISSRLDLDPARISYFGHHFSHAATAFLGSGFAESAILVVDAVGDWASTGLYRGAWRDGRPVIERVKEVAFPNSLGLVYSAVTAWLGFSPNDSECSTMALASFGEPRYLEQMRAVVARDEETVYRVDQRYFHFTGFYRGAVTRRFLDAFGPARAPSRPLPFASFGDGAPVDADDQRYADVATSLQRVLEERSLDLAAALRRAVDSEHLCFAGGVAMNCVNNARLRDDGPFAKVFIPPDPGDGGAAVGAALYYDATARAAGVTARYTPYLGTAPDERADVALVDHVDVSHLRPYLKPGAPEEAQGPWQRARFESPEALCEEVAGRLAAGQIVGWFQGRAELGPRALGNRSILARADALETARRLSRAVKERAAFRPYALAVAEEDAPGLLDLDAARYGETRWMQYAVRVRPEQAARVGGGLHVDGSTRAQVCGAGDNPRLHALLRAYGRRSGLGALINTSFNASGYPIVQSPVEALAMFARTGMDAVALNDTLVWKHRG